ncbi:MULTISPECIES: YeeE/YedE family protein [unclassified Brevibacterium]|uniref:YeeE/YedE family protein n=1 Tax=unclassified Brevibacterium TaxID=2614124 RepID=UPI002550DD11|nr:MULTISPECIES: YeeE/YedE family protein [unclassified Brevibacterium]MDK8436806.1 YeeE/YedE family protein [Brevibacterium sp. H-BE7]
MAHLLTERWWNPFATAVVIGIIATIAWPLSAATGRNSGLGITTPSANLTGYLATGDTELIDWGVMLVIGILVGSFIAAKASGEFRIRVRDQATIIKSILGGIGMRVGAAIAGGCTVGNAMVSTAQFEYQGWVATLFMIVGAGVAAKATIKPKQSAAAVPTTESRSA